MQIMMSNKWLGKITCARIFRYDKTAKILKITIKISTFCDNKKINL